MEERQRERETRHGETERLRMAFHQRETNRVTDRQGDRKTTDKQGDRKTTDRQGDRKTERQTNRQVYRQ